MYELHFPQLNCVKDSRDNPNKPDMVPQEPRNSIGLFKTLFSGEKKIPAAAFKSWGLKAFLLLRMHIGAYVML